jgi:hypothetical protein
MLALRMDPDLSHAHPHGLQWLPVTWHQPILHAPELISGKTPSLGRKVLQIFKGRPDPNQGLVDHLLLYTYLYKRATTPPRT